MTISSGNRSDSSKARWLTLRRAFVSAVAAANGSEDGTISPHGSRQKEKRFDGFKLFPRHEEEEGPLLRSGEGDVLATYRLPDGSEVKTREASSDGARGRAPVTLAQLFSHRVHGVDNTGNVRVWPSEQVLLHALLTGPLAPSLRGARVLELGAGKCGLAGLGVAVGSEAAEVVITDGNPDAVKNLQACVELNEKDGKGKGGFGATKVLARRLVWDRLDRDGSRLELIKSCGYGGFDLVIASDCLFFKDFHDDLRSTIAHLLAPRGRAILVQPQRGGTVDLFLRCVYDAASPPPSAPDPSKASATSLGASGGKGCAAEADGGTDLGEAARPCPYSRHEPLLDARLVRRFDGRVWAMHLDYVRKESLGDGGSGEVDRGYLPDRHLPLLVELCRRTPEKEERGEDGSGATSDNDLFWTPWPENLPSAVEEGNSAIDESGAGGINQKTAAGAQEGKYSGGVEARKDSQPRRSDARVAPGDPAGVLVSSLEDRYSTGPVPCSAVMAKATASNQSSDRPDCRMDAVYEDLARRLITKVRDGRKVRGQQEGGVDSGGKGERTEGRPAPEQGRQLWVAIAGAPGSGKTTLAAKVCRLVQEVYPAVCVPMDGFHFYRRELDAMPDPAEAHRRRGAHWTFDGERFLREVAAARSSGRGSFPGFDHAVGDPVENAWQVHPFHEVVIVEGNYLLLKGIDPWDKASGLFDEVWAIRCPPEVCGERVTKRHIETGLNDGEARVRVQKNDLPNARLVQDSCPWGEVDVVIHSL